MSSSKVFSTKMRKILTGGASVALLCLFGMTAAKFQTHEVFESCLFFVGTFLAGVAIAGRAWSLVYISGKKNTFLVTAGPYSLCRNPLYFFSMLGVLGVGFMSETITIPGVGLFAFLIYYRGVIGREEEKLRAKFGSDFELYCSKVPRLIPRLAGLQEPIEITISPRHLRRGLKDLVYFACFAGALELLEALHTVGWLPIYFRLY